MLQLNFQIRPKSKEVKMSYKHLTQQERYLINAYRRIKRQKEIAEIIGVHPSTVCRELKRGKGSISGQDYWSVASQNRADALQQQKSKQANFKLTEETVNLIQKYLKQEYSPEQISATLERKHSIKISYVIYEKRWRVEEFYKSLKHNVDMAKSPTKTIRTQSNHIFLSILAFFKLELLKIKYKTNHFALRAKLLIKANQMAYQELLVLRGA
jgi:IS30 family transposase